MVAIVLCGQRWAGKSELARILEHQHGYQRINLRKDGLESFDLLEGDASLTLTVEQAELLVMNEWNVKHFVIDSLSAVSQWELFGQRPSFLLVAVEAAASLRHARSGLSADEFIQSELTNSFTANLTIINDGSMEELSSTVRSLQLHDPGWLRPRWDDYFMEMANLVSYRSNCMKRRVGALVVVDKRVLATGYNGTAMGLPNCNEGGCARCNGNARCGHALDSCICLHAEENALLQQPGNLRHLSHPPATLYCTLSPCFGCAKKLIQVGIKRVVYGKPYSLAHDTRQIMEMAGVQLEQYQPSRPKQVFSSGKSGVHI